MEAIQLPKEPIHFHSRPICSKVFTSAATHHLLVPFPNAPVLSSQLFPLPTMPKPYSEPISCG